MDTQTFENTKQKIPFFTLRALLAFVVLALILVGIYLWGFRSYAVVAEWVKPGSHDALMYEGELYQCVGPLTEKGRYTFSKYPMDAIVGKVYDDGTPVVTEAPTLPPDAESGETVELIPPYRDPSLAREHPFVLYSVKNKENILILLESDDQYSLYFRVCAEWSAPESDASFVMGEKTYHLVGRVGSAGLSGSKYTKDAPLGLLCHEKPPKSGEYTVYTVKQFGNLLIVSAPNNSEYLYDCEGTGNPVS